MKRDKDVSIERYKKEFNVGTYFLGDNLLPRPYICKYLYKYLSAFIFEDMLDVLLLRAINRSEFVCESTVTRDAVTRDVVRDIWWYPTTNILELMLMWPISSV